MDFLPAPELTLEEIHILTHAFTEQKIVSGLSFTVLGLGNENQYKAFLYFLFYSRNNVIVKHFISFL